MATAVPVMRPFFPVLAACGGRPRSDSTCPRVGCVFFQPSAPLQVLAVTARVVSVAVVGAIAARAGAKTNTR